MRLKNERPARTPLHACCSWLISERRSCLQHVLRPFHSVMMERNRVSFSWGSLIIISNFQLIPLVSVVWGLSVVGGSRSKLLNQAFLSKITIIKVFSVSRLTRTFLHFGVFFLVRRINICDIIQNKSQNEK